MWLNPIPFYQLIVTSESNSYLDFPYDATGIPIQPHVGSYGIQRKFDIHTGIDLYCPENTSVHAVESGTVIDVGIFTGESVNSPWWLETSYITIEGPSGIVLYGEVDPLVKISDNIQAGQKIATIKRVLRNDKGRPTSMLHLELFQNNINVDPTPYLRNIIENA